MPLFQPNTGDTRPGLLLVGHGTRSSAGIAEFLETADQVAQRLAAVAVQGAFLELAEPTIAEGLARLVERGARRVVVMPLLLFAAGHAERDIPAAVAQAAARWPELSLVQADYLGCQEAILELAGQRFSRAAVAAIPPRDTALVLAGRGSFDQAATAETHRFTELLARRTLVGKAVAGFLAMAEPKLPAVLEQTAREGWRQIVVQPHLLFQGELLEDFVSHAAAAQARWPNIAWGVAAHLGPSPLLADAIISRAAER